MNKSIIIGRLVADPTLTFAAGSGIAVSRFKVAVNRPNKKDGKQEADFIPCIAFGKTAETIAQHFTKGRQIAVEGHITTGSYDNKQGHKVYTTDVTIDRFEFIGHKEGASNYNPSSSFGDELPPDMTPIDDGDIPF